MATEVEASTWIASAVKAIGTALAAAFAWVWHTSHRQAVMGQRIQSLEKRTRRIEAGVGRILNHLTGTDLHEIEVGED